MTQQFISFRLKEVPHEKLYQPTRHWFINLDMVPSISVTDTRIDFFFPDEEDQVTILKDEHPIAYQTIRDFLLKRWRDHCNIIEE